MNLRDTIRHEFYKAKQRFEMPTAVEIHPRYWDEVRHHLDSEDPMRIAGVPVVFNEQCDYQLKTRPFTDAEREDLFLRTYPPDLWVK